MRYQLGCQGETAIDRNQCQATFQNIFHFCEKSACYAIHIMIYCVCRTKRPTSMATIETDINMDSVLCFVSRPWAYFTTQSLSDQLGDGWTNKPWTQAGEPYLHRHYNPEHKPNKWEIYKIAYDGFWTLPYEIFPNTDHPTVSSINNDKLIPWLRSDFHFFPEKLVVMAGTTLSDFCKLMQANGGNAYIPISR